MKGLLTVIEAAAETGYDARYIRRKCAEGAVPCERITSGKCVLLLIRRADLAKIPAPQDRGARVMKRGGR